MRLRADNEPFIKLVFNKVKGLRDHRGSGGTKVEGPEAGQVTKMDESVEGHGGEVQEKAKARALFSISENSKVLLFFGLYYGDVKVVDILVVWIWFLKL